MPRDKIEQSRLSKEHYQRNKESYRQCTVARRAANRRFVKDYLAHHPCVDCGEADIDVLDFDHVLEGQKIAGIAQLVCDGSVGSIKREIEKCEVRCANCHRRVTAKRRRALKSAEAGMHKSTKQQPPDRQMRLFNHGNH